MAITIDELRSFLAQSPPRVVPREIRKKALRRISLGVILFSLIFFFFGLPFALVFFPRRLPDDLLLNSSAQSTQNGVVVSRTETSMSENNNKILKLEFSFTADDGSKYSGVCYATHTMLQDGDRAPIEYLPKNPDVCRIQGCRLSAFSWGAVFVLIFPAVGLVITLILVRFRRRLARLLVNGTFSTGRVISVDRTSVRVNNERQHRIGVSFNDGFNERATSYKAYGEDVDLARRKHESGDTIGLLYDPHNPKHVFLVDGLLESGQGLS